MDFGYYSFMKTAFIRVGRYGLKITLAALGLGAILYLLLFTSLGNNVFKPLIEKNLTTVFNTPIRIDTFALTHNALTIQFHDTVGNSVNVQGQFSLITLNFHALYHAKIVHNGGINTFGLPLKTSGSLNGGYGLMNMHGSVNLFDGEVLYRAQFKRLRPSDMHISIKNIDYQSLMQWLEYPHQSSTVLTGKIDLHGIERRDIQGEVTLRTHTQNFSPSELVDDNSSFDLISLFTDDQGKIQPFHLNLTLDASVDELGILEQFAMLPLRGSGNLDATIQGDQERLVLDAKSNIAYSTSHARVHWKKLRPSYLYVDIKNADAATLFHLFSQPSPIEGKVDLDAESNITKTTANLRVTRGLTHPDILKRQYRLTQPQTRFSTNISAQATPKMIHYQALYKSDLARTQINNTTTHERMLHDLLKAIP